MFLSKTNIVSRCILTLILICSFSLSAMGEGARSLDLTKFASLSIQNEGRIKPLDTYARSLLLQISSRSSYRGKPAIHWLSNLLFSPENARMDKIFRVNNHQTIEALGLALPEERRYSFKELEKGINKLQTLAHEVSKLEEKMRSPVEEELLRLYYNISIYTSLSKSFNFSRSTSAFFIKNDNLEEMLGFKKGKGEHSFLEMLDREVEISNYTNVNNIDSAKYNLDSIALLGIASEAARLKKEIFFWKKFNRDREFTIIPPFNNSVEVFFSPWDLLSNSAAFGLQNEIRALADVSVAYRNNSQMEFDLALKSFDKIIQGRASWALSGNHGNLEILYNKFQPFKIAKIFYLISLLCVLVSLIGKGKWAYVIGIGLAIVAIVPHTWGIASRMVIMSRPPITNLFETFITVSWVCCILGFVTEWFQRNKLGLIVSTFSAVSLLFISDKYAREGDTLSMLVAVLDTNFWLSTHVVAISLGYAGCCAAGIAGHVYLLQRMFGAKPEQLRTSHKAVYGILAFGLVFSFIGTVLGGIWADQSWGRFWGWDPKENGALLIVLWCSALFHARLGGRIKELGFAAGSVIGITIVMFAWFGINLLGVGLHSYGFSSGVFVNFFLFIVFEVLFLTISIIWILKKTARKSMI